MSSYEEFASCYDALIREDVNYEAWGNFIKGLIKNNNVEKNSYLDIGCGTGNLTVELAADFKEVYCVDLSEDMLRQAQEKFLRRKLSVRLVKQDMCKLYLNSQFDLITCALDAANYLLSEEELRLFFRGVKKHLKHGGIFIFDMNTYYKLTEILGNSSYNYSSEELCYLWDNTLEEDIVSMELTFFVKEGELYRKFEELHEERAYKEERITTLLREEGLRLFHVYDGYSFKEPEKSCERLVYVVGQKE